MPVGKFIIAAAIRRSDLLKGKAQALSNLATNFIKDGGFTASDWGTKEVNKLLHEHGLENDDESVVAFVQNVVGEYIALLAFQTGPDDYKFHLVSGSADEIRRMTK